MCLIAVVHHELLRFTETKFIRSYTVLSLRKDGASSFSIIQFRRFNRNRRSGKSGRLFRLNRKITGRFRLKSSGSGFSRFKQKICGRLVRFSPVVRFLLNRITGCLSLVTVQCPEGLTFRDVVLYVRI